MSGSVVSYFTDPKVRALVRAVDRQDVPAIDKALASGTDINAIGREGVTPLWWAIRFYRIVSFQYLLERGADPNKAIPNHWSVLDLAAGYVDPQYLRLALAHKADPNRVNGLNNDLPICVAIEYGKKGNLLQFIAAGANLDGAPEGWLPLEVAVTMGRYEFVYLMLKAGADGAKEIPSHSFIKVVGIRGIDPDSDAYVWRERVIALLKEKGITVAKPKLESPRTKPLPPDWEEMKP